MPRPSPCWSCRPAKPTISHGTATCPALGTDCAWVPVARCCALGSCSIAVPVPPVGYCSAPPGCSGPKRRGRRPRGPCQGRARRGPQADRADRRGKDRLTLRALVDDYLAAKQPHLRPRSFVEAKRYLTSGYFKPLHGMPLDTITRRDIAARVVAIVRERGSPTAARARGALSSFFVWAMQMGLVENNPTIGSTKPAESKPRERVLSDEELARIWRACGDDAFGKI